METLPEEMVEAVASYLTVRDLAACCLVSRGWRDAFNHDSVWRCHSSGPSRAQHLRASPQVVGPRVNRPDYVGTSLSPMCELKESVSNEEHLWNNLRKGRFEKSTIINKAFVAERIYFLTNDHIVLISKNQIIVWNVHDNTDDGFFEPVKLSYDSKVRLCKMTNDNNVVVVQERLVYVFLWHLNSTQWSFQYAFVFNESSNLFTSLGSVLFPEKNENSHYTFEIFGNIFFGCVSCEAKIHIWDLEKNVKFKEEELPLECPSQFYYKEFLCDRQNKHVLINLVLECHEATGFLSVVYYVYDLKNFVLLPFRHPALGPLRLPYPFNVINGKYFAVTLVSFLVIFNIETNQSYAITLVSGPPMVFRESFIFYRHGKVEIFNPKTKKTTTVVNDVLFYKDLLNIGDKFIVVYHKKCNTLFCDVWEIKNNLEASEAKTKLYYWNPEFMLANEAGTILLSVSKAEGRICKLCFW